MPNGLHTHSYQGVTSIADNHDHRFNGNTSKDQDYMGHSHFMEGSTAENGNHIHHYQIRTGPAIYMEGGHYHTYQGDTSMTHIHIHHMSGYTSLD